MSRLPTIPTLPGIRKREIGRTAKREDRRKAPRLGVGELNEFGAEALRKRLPEITKPEDRRPAIVKLLDVIDVPRNVVANIIAGLTGTKTADKERGTLGIPKVFTSDILKKLGVTNRVVRAVAGFAGDVALDPLTYATLGATTGTKIAQHLPRVLKSGTKLLKTTAQTGRASGEVAKALGIRRTLGVVRGLAKKRGVAAVKKALVSKRGGALNRLLVKRATAGNKEALAFLAKHGEKGRSLFRLPFAAVGAPILKVGAKARKARAVAEGLTEAGQKGFRHLAKFGASKRFQLARQTARLAVEAAERGRLGEAKQQGARLKEVVKGLKARFDEVRKATVSAKAKGLEGVTRTAVPTAAVRRAERDFDLAQGLLSRVNERLKQQGLVGKLKGKFEVTAGGEKALQRAVKREQRGALLGVKPGLIAKRNIRQAGLQAARKGAPKLTTFPPGLQTARVPKQLAQTELTSIGKRIAQTKGRVKLAKEGAEEAGELAAKRASEIARFSTGPDAPGVTQELQRALTGPRFVEGAPGLVNTIRGVKRKLFGQGRSALAQELAGARSRFGVKSAMIRARTRAELDKTLQPLLGRLAETPQIQQNVGGAKELQRALVAIIEAGPEGRAIGTFGQSDAIHQVYAKARNAGLLEDPGVRDLVETYRAAVDRLTPPGGVPDYFPRISTKEARPFIRIQEARISPRAGRQTAGGRLSVIQPSDLRRSKMVTLADDAGRTQEILSSNRVKLQEALSQGFKKVDERAISTAQWNKIASEGRLKGVLGPDFEGVEKFRGPLFEEDVALGLGERTAQAERAAAAKQVAQAVEPFAVRAKQGLAEKAQGFAHLRAPKRPPANSPFASRLEGTGIYSKKYPTQVPDALDATTEIWNHDPAIASLLNATDTALGWWKNFQLYHPAYIIRNVFQNFFGGLMAGANPIAVAKRSFATPEVRLLRKALVNNTPEILRGSSLNISGRQMPLVTIYDRFLRRNLTGSSRTSVEMRKMSDVGLSRAGKEIDIRTQKLKGIVFRGNALVEDLQKIGTTIHFMDKGMDADSAAIRVLTAMPDLSDLSVWEKEVGRRIFPFFSWMRRNGALQLFHHLPRKPAFAALLPRLKNFGEAFAVKDKVPEEFRPTWMKEQMATQVSGGREGGQTFLPMNWLPFEEMYQALAIGIQPGEAARRAVSSARPGLRFVGELATGINTFKQAPYSGGTKITTAALMKAFPQALVGNSGTQLDTLFALRPLREWSPWGGRVAAQPTLGGKVTRAVLGGALQPVSLERGVRAEQARLREQALQLRRKINQARSARDAALAEDLMKQWIATQRRLHEIGGAGVAKSTAQVFQQAGIQQREAI